MERLRDYFALPLLASLILTSCSSGISEENVSNNGNVEVSQTNTDLDAYIVPGVTECDNADEISPGGKYICAYRGTGYWVLRSEYEAEESSSLNDPDEAVTQTESYGSISRTLENASGTYWTINPNYTASQFQLVYLTGNFEAYEDSTGKCFAFRFENSFDSDQVATTYGYYYRGRGTWKTLYISNLNVVLFDGTFGGVCSSKVQSSLGGEFR